MARNTRLGDVASIHHWLELSCSELPGKLVTVCSDLPLTYHQPGHSIFDLDTEGAEVRYFRDKSAYDSCICFVYYQLVVLDLGV